ncbi:MAG TPA: hypothetical protein VF646_03480 [Cytophagales bacterium]
MATFMNRILAVGAVAGLLASCTSSKIGLVNTAPANPSVAVTAPSDEAAPAAAQGAPAGEAYASTAENVAAVATGTAVSPLEKAAREQAAVATAPKGEAKKLSTVERVVAKALVKKLQKAEKKFDVKKQKAGKAADPQVRTGIIIALVGLGLLLVGALTGLWFLYTLGGLGITVGLVVILLAALDVI